MCHIFKALLFSPTFSSMYHRKKWASILGNVSAMVTKRSFHNDMIDLSTEVKNHLNDGLKPVVALESTIITHGMPYPDNLNVALEVEEIVRSQGAVPATVGIIDGRIKVGLSCDELSRLASPNGTMNRDTGNVIKTSRRDLPYVVGKGLCGGTTVSGTIVICDMVGIKIFVTGGIGGVHRDVERTMDVSADLIELSRHSITVISSGVKSILDVPRTLEYLETVGVCVITYGEKKEFPGFYTRESGCSAPYNVANIKEAAQIVFALNKLNPGSGLLLAVPVPHEYCTLEYEVVEKVIQDSLSEARQKCIHGKEVTPFVLHNINSVTNGQLLLTNIGLIKNNALIGSQIAVHLHNISGRNSFKHHPVKVDTNKDERRLLNGHVLKSNGCFETGGRRNFSSHCCSPIIIGGSNLDCIVVPNKSIKMGFGGMVPGKLRQTGGGVGRNIAEALSKLEVKPFFLSAVGDDPAGRFIVRYAEPFLNCNDVLVCEDGATAHCIVILDPKTGENVLLIGDMMMHDNISERYVMDKLSSIGLSDHSPVLLLDGNLPTETISAVINYCHGTHTSVWFEPTDVVNTDKLFIGDLWKRLHFVSPNMQELCRMYSAIKGGDDFSDRLNNHNDARFLLDAAIKLAVPLAKHINTVMVTLGKHGLLVISRTNSNLDTSISFTSSAYSDKKMSARYYTSIAVDTESIASVSGAGDCCVAGYMKGVLCGLSEPECIAIGLSAAKDSLHSINTVPDQFQTLERDLQFKQPHLIINLEDSIDFMD